MDGTLYNEPNNSAHFTQIANKNSDPANHELRPLPVKDPCREEGMVNPPPPSNPFVGAPKAISSSIDRCEELGIIFRFAELVQRQLHRFDM
jgi:hypothetical protein